MKKIVLGLFLLCIVAGFVVNAVYPYYKSFSMDGKVRSVDYNSSTQVADCIMVNEITGRIVEFKATGKRWKIVEVDTCIQVKMYPSIFPTEAGAFKMVNLEKILDCRDKKNLRQDQSMVKPGSTGPRKKSEEAGLKEETQDSKEESILDKNAVIEI